MNNRLKRLVIAWAIGASVIVLSFASLALYKFEPTACPPGMICINPQRVSCFVSDMTVERWRPSSAALRGPISAQVSDRKAEYKFEQAGIDCYELDKHFVLGNLVAQLPVEWWRPVRGRK